MQTLPERIRRFVRFLDASLPDSCLSHLWTQARTDLQTLADHLDRASPALVDVDSMLSAFLAANLDASEKEALAAMNAAGFKRLPEWLRKNPAWREHVNQRIREYVRSHPDCTGPEEISTALGCVKSTIHAQQAYQELRPLLNERKAERRRKREKAKVAKKRTSARSLAYRTVRKDVKYGILKDVDDMRKCLRLSNLYKRMPAYRDLIDHIEDAVLQGWIDRAKKARAAYIAGQGKGGMSEEEETARGQARVHAARRREDNK